MQALGCKLFFIGFNKCGTTSLHRWLVDAGIRSFHGGGGEIDHHAVILANVARGRPALDGFDQYDAYLDVRAVQEQFRALDRDYPGSKFVLNTRNVDRWIVSRLNHLDGGYVSFMNLYYGVDLSWSEWAAIWRREFAEHEAAVDQHFKLSGSPFLRFDIEADTPSDLAAFLCLQGAADDLPRENTTPTSQRFGFTGGRIVSLAETSEAVLQRDAAIAERETAQAQRDAALAERDRALAERDAAIAERDGLAAERIIVLAHREGLMQETSARAAVYARLAAELDRLIADRDEIIADRGRIIAHGERLAAEVKALAIERGKLELELGHVAADLRAIHRSRSWRFTAPLRGLVRRLGGAPVSESEAS